MNTETSHTLLRQLKFSINSEEHTPNEWQEILKKINEIGTKASMRLNMFNNKEIERIIDKEIDILEK